MGHASRNDISTPTEEDKIKAKVHNLKSSLPDSHPLKLLIEIFGAEANAHIPLSFMDILCLAHPSFSETNDQMDAWFTDSIPWPFAGIPATAKRVVFLYNPTRIHWVAVEVSFSDNGGKIIVYNPLRSSEKGATLKLARNELPLLCELDSKRPGSPLALNGFTWTSNCVEYPLCPQQDEDIAVDCGPVSLLSALFRLNTRSYQRRNQRP